MSESEAERTLRSQIQFIKKTGGGRMQIDAAIAQSIFQEDIELYDSPRPIYHLTREKADRLIAHTRQDAAHAVISIGSVYNELKSTKRILFCLAACNLVLLAGVLGLSLKVFR